MKILSNGRFNFNLLDGWYLYVDDLISILLLLQDEISNFTILIFMIGFLWDMETLILWLYSQIFETDPSLSTDIISQISSKVLICDDRVYHRKFRYKLKMVIIDFKEIQKHFIEQLESQWLTCCVILKFKFSKLQKVILESMLFDNVCVLSPIFRSSLPQEY